MLASMANVLAESYRLERARTELEMLKAAGLGTQQPSSGEQSGWSTSHSSSTRGEDPPEGVDRKAWEAVRRIFGETGSADVPGG